MTTDPSTVLRAQVLRRGGRFAIPIPDALMAVICALAALADFVPMPAGFVNSRDELFFALIVEGGFLMMQGTLVDIATRLKKRPPVWAVPIILIAVVLFSQYSLGILKLAWQRGSLVFIPLLFSLAERGMVLWNMPNRSHIEKVAARALIGNRITTGLAVLAFVAISGLSGLVYDHGWPIFAPAALYFAVAAFDDWRVRGPRFAERPRVLFGFDVLHIHYLDPL